MTSFADKLAHLAYIARQAPGADAEWFKACDMLAKGDDVVPLADMVAPAFLPEVGEPVQRAAAINCAEYILHTLRERDAQAAIARAKGYMPSRVHKLTEAGWTRDEVFEAMGASDAARSKFMRERAKARKG